MSCTLYFDGYVGNTGKAIMGMADMIPRIAWKWVDFLEVCERVYEERWRVYNIRDVNCTLCPVWLICVEQHIGGFRNSLKCIMN